jgi:HK97 family phage major capsid protein
MQDAGIIPDDPQLGALLTQAQSIQEKMADERADRDELRKELGEVKGRIDEWQTAKNKADADAKLQAEIKAMVDGALASSRTESKAHLVGSPQPKTGDDQSFFATLARARSRGMSDIKAQLEATEELASVFGSTWAGIPAESKATVGDSDGAGGYLVPNNVVADINIQATPGRAVVELFTVIDGVRGSAVDIPWEDGLSTFSRAVIASPGATKENKNFLVNNYTATLYTLARIFDVGNPLLRQSEGAAEKLVRSSLARAFALGEDYYAIQGTGSSQPYGLLTALGTSGTYVTTHSSPATTTIAGNWATAVAKAAGAIADRGGVPTAVVLNSGDYWNSIVSGADAAGFYVDPQGGGFNFNPQSTGTTGAGPWGLALRHTPNMPTDSLVVGDYKSAMFFRGQGYRVDVSSEAGDRWDKNLTGFRGEEEIAFDARPAVYTGNFQRIVNVMA